jgi:hypothetical protein
MKKNSSTSRSKPAIRGDALLMSLIVAVIVALMGAAATSLIKYRNQSLRYSRIRAIMNQVDLRVRRAVESSPASGGAVLCTAPVAGAAPACTLNANSIAFRRSPVLGAVCTTAGCGVVVKNPALTGTVFTARIEYEGREISVKSLSISVDLAHHLPVFLSCPDSQPLFKKIVKSGEPGTAGSLVCAPAPGPMSCGTGQYLKRVKGGLIAECASLPANISCPPTQYFSNVDWNGGSLNFQCIDRQACPYAGGCP